ncbi:MAG: hypothetical protein ACYDD4_07155 [Acidimicrobiales bacterium]
MKADTSPARRPPLGPVAMVVLRHPSLWLVGAVQGLRQARPRWWRDWPPLPAPDESWWRFRMETAYGGHGDTTARPEDVESFLRWCRDMHRWRRV